MSICPLSAAKLTGRIVDVDVDVAVAVPVAALAVVVRHVGPRQLSVVKTPLRRGGVGL